MPQRSMKMNVTTKERSCRIPTLEINAPAKNLGVAVELEPA